MKKLVSGNMIYSEWWKIVILEIYAIALKIGSTLNLDNSVREKFFFVDAIARQCKTEGVFFTY